MARPAYYNENESYCADWLRNLIEAGHLPPGDVDERDVRSVQPDDLAGYGQCHFFAGIGGWARACRLAGVPDDEPIWTGSPPCQPFSVGGRRRGTADDRHLWPEMARLVASCRPAAVAVENVANIVGMALDGMLLDLETAGYSARAFVVPACAIDAPHRRDRVWIAAVNMAHSDGIGSQGVKPSDALPRGRRLANGDDPGDVVNTASIRRREGRAEHGLRGGRDAAPGAGGFWDDAGWIAGRDGKARRVALAPVRGLDARLSAGMAGVRPETIPLLETRVPDRVAKLKALGNSICPQVAAEIIRAMRQDPTEGETS
jgi:DNA (cytosine-5)-methyltransferase 1